MSEFKTAAYACFVSCEDKTRKFFYNDEGVYEGTYKGYDLLEPSSFNRVVGNSVPFKKTDFNVFINSLFCGHDFFGIDKTHPTRDNLLFPEGANKMPINQDAA